jgi:hypothetical protein
MPAPQTASGAFAERVRPKMLRQDGMMRAAVRPAKPPICPGLLRAAIYKAPPSLANI